MLEFFGGWWTGSLAIWADALHDLGDSFALGMAWYLERLSGRRPTARFSYGPRRLSLLGAMLNGAILVVGSVIILAQAVPRLFDPQEVYAPGMLLFALIGVVVNGWAVLKLRHEQTLNARLVAWHLLEDVMGWTAVLLVSIVLQFWDAYVLDPMLSILITIYILRNVLRNLEKTVLLFLQAVPADIRLDEFEQRLAAIPAVQSTHHTHVWSLDGERNVLTTHLVVDSAATRDEIQSIKRSVREIADRHSIAHITIDIEYTDEPCVMDGEDPARP